MSNRYNLSTKLTIKKNKKKTHTTSWTPECTRRYVTDQYQLGSEAANRKRDLHTHTKTYAVV